MIAEDVKLGRGVIIHHPELVNLYGCIVGDESTIGAFVEIQRGVRIGRRVKIQAFAFIPEGVEVADGAFIGPHACFVNDRHPRAVDAQGALLRHGDWKLERTYVGERAAIGANATIMCGLTVGEDAVVAAGAVVTHDVPNGAVVAGNPARVVGRPRA